MIAYGIADLNFYKIIVENETCSKYSQLFYAHNWWSHLLSHSLIYSL